MNVHTPKSGRQFRNGSRLADSKLAERNEAEGGRVANTPLRVNYKLGTFSALSRTHHHLRRPRIRPCTSETGTRVSASNRAAPPTD